MYKPLDPLHSNPDTAVEFWDGCTPERYLSSSKPYSLAPMMGERVGWGEGEARKRTASQHARRTEYAPVKTPTRFLFAHLGQGLEVAGF